MAPRRRAGLVVVLLVAGCAVHPVAGPIPIRAPAPTPGPTATAAAPQPVPHAPTPIPARVAVPAHADFEPPLVRVLLEKVGEPALPQPGRRYACVSGDAVFMLRGPISAIATAGRPAVQVGAFASEGNAAAALQRLEAAGFAAASLATGSMRCVIAVGRQGEGAEQLGQRLRRAGFADQKAAAPEGREVILTGEGGASVRAPSVTLVPFDPDPVRVGDKRVRGVIEIRPAAAGAAVINVLNLEAYLRGVVPAEMGPRNFPALEALKAQAVAARTYAVAHLGDHAADGYDLCDTPACQAYGGESAEQPLSDRAVRETAGEIATYQGRPIDAMYQSTCGGHTEDAGALFPQRAAPYLKGVACRGDREIQLGEGARGRRWLGPVARLAAVGEALARSLRVQPEAHALASRLTGAPAAAGAAGIIDAFAVEPVAATLGVVHGPTRDDAALDLLRLFHLQLPPPPAQGGREWELALTVRLGELRGEVRAEEGLLVAGPSGARLVLPADGGWRDVPARVAVLERRGERWRAGPLRFPAGSRGTLWCTGASCPVIEVDALEQADERSAWSWWVRDFTLADLAQRLGAPGARQVTVLRRGVSGRALALRVTGANGDAEIGGIAFRRALDLPDTLFVVGRVPGPGRARLRFLGRGWGHGVGMCQNGAYGLALGGASYVEILKTYYTGVEVTRWEGEDDVDHGKGAQRGR